jgi:hypothetical protein
MAKYTQVMLEETLLLTQRIAYNSDGYEQYIGYARPGADEGSDEWLIHELIYDTSNRMVQKLFAEGSKSFNQKWTARASYEYK